MGVLTIKEQSERRLTKYAEQQMDYELKSAPICKNSADKTDKECRDKALVLMLWLIGVNRRPVLQLKQYFKKSPATLTQVC